MQAIFIVIFTAVAVVLDQLSKYLVVAYIPLYGHVDVLPGIVGLTYYQNDGAAWSMLSGQQWLFAVIFVAFTVMVIWEYKAKYFPFSGFERWCIASIYAGGLGNMIDRIRLGYVVDMIQTEFIDFPVFNVADSFITCGCIALIFHLVFFNKSFWKEEKKTDN